MSVDSSGRSDFDSAAPPSPRKDPFVDLLAGSKDQGAEEDNNDTFTKPKGITTSAAQPAATSTTDVAIYDEELTSLEEEIRDALDASDSLGGDARHEKLEKAGDLIKRIGKLFHQFKYELRMVESMSNEELKYEQTATEHQVVISKLKAELTQKRSCDTIPCTGDRTSTAEQG